MTRDRGRCREGIEAKCTDGVLEVAIPLPKEEKKQAVTIKPKSD